MEVLDYMGFESTKLDLYMWIFLAVHDNGFMYYEILLDYADSVSHKASGVTGEIAYYYKAKGGSFKLP